jgi:hypothetical protein
MRCLARQTGALGVVTDFLRAFGSEEELAERGQVQRGAAADQIDHADQGTAGRGAFEINDFVVVAGAEVDCLTDFFVQFLHVGQGHFAHADPRFDDVAEFEQADAEAIGAGVLPFDEAGCAHRGQDAVGGRWVEFGGLGQLLQAGCIRGGSEGVEQRHHALDDLDGAGRFGRPAGSFGQLISFMGGFE